MRRESDRDGDRDFLSNLELRSLSSELTFSLLSKALNSLSRASCCAGIVYSGHTEVHSRSVTRF
jgi:hypothetical protein